VYILWDEALGKTVTELAHPTEYIVCERFPRLSSEMSTTSAQLDTFPNFIGEFVITNG
jgi:hypothetical protein